MVGVAFEDGVLSDGGFAVLVVDDVHGREGDGHVFAHGEVDGVVIFFEVVVDDGDVCFFDLVFLELDGEVSVGGVIAGEDDEAGGIAIETVGDGDFGVLGLEAGGE